MSKIDATVLKDGQLAVATLEQSGTLISGASAIDTTCLVQTEDGVQQCVKTFPLGEGGGGGGGGADTSLSNLTAAGKEVAATMSMPSDAIEELSNIASNQLITAPADGYFTAIPPAGAGNTVFITVKASTATSVDDDSMLMLRMTETVNNTPRGFIPIRKGQKLVVNPITATPLALRFCYAKGSEPQQ